MPEDIPETEEFQPEPSPVLVASNKPNTPRSPYRVDLLIAIIAFIFGLGWAMSGFPANIIGASCCFSVCLGLVLHYCWPLTENWKPKWLRLFAATLIIVTIVCFAWKPIEHQYYLQHHPTPADGRVYSAVTNYGASVVSLMDNLASNSDPKTALWESKMQDANRDGITIQTRLDSDTDLTSIASLSDKLENLKSQKANADRQAQIQQAIDAREDELNAPKMAQQNYEIQKQASAPILPIFEQVIFKLQDALGKYAAQTGDDIHWTFSSPTVATIYGSNLEKENCVIDGTNTIYLGTNSAWQFQVSTISPQVKIDRFNWPETALSSIQIATADGRSTLKITTRSSTHVTFFHGGMNLPPGTNLTVVNVSIRLVTTDELLNFNQHIGLDRTKGKQGLEPSDLGLEINKALINLMAAQNEASPLNAKR